MRKNYAFTDEYAVSEVVGAVLLIGVAVIVFVSIYHFVLPVPLPSHEPNVHLEGYVTEDGSVVLEHMGGEALASYEIYVDGASNCLYQLRRWE